MEEQLKQLMQNKSDDDLNRYITYPEEYTPEVLNAAWQEFGNRGHVLNENDTQRIQRLLERKDDLTELTGGMKIADSGYDDIVTAEVPQYYSKNAIGLFSVLFSVIFGAVLFAYNVTDKTVKRIVIAYGIAYTSLVAAIINQGPRNSILTLVLNGFGGMLLTSLFWNKYIGKGVQYDPRPIWKPLLISVLISLPFVLAAIFYRG